MKFANNESYRLQNIYSQYLIKIQKSEELINTIGDIRDENKGRLKKFLVDTTNDTKKDIIKLFNKSSSGETIENYEISKLKNDIYTKFSQLILVYKLSEGTDRNKIINDYNELYC